jgi:hypothetical protein
LLISLKEKAQSFGQTVQAIFHSDLGTATLDQIEPSEDFENDFIPLDQFERIECYKWNPQDPNQERRRYDR